MDIPNTFQQGVKAAQYGNPICARSFLEQASSEQPDHADMWVWMAWASYSPTEAIEFIDRAEALSPDNNLFRAFRIVLESLARYECSKEATLGQPLQTAEPLEEERESFAPPNETETDKPQEATSTATETIIMPDLSRTTKATVGTEPAKSSFDTELDIPSELQATADGEDVLFNMEDRQRLAQLAAVEPLHVEDENMDDTPVCEEVDVVPPISPPLTDQPVNKAATLHITQTHSSSPIDSQPAVLATPPPPPSQAVPPEAATETQYATKSTAHEFQASDPSPSPAKPSIPPRPRTVLIVAENLKMQNCLSEALHGRGMEVTTQAQLALALAEAQERKPGLIVLDGPLQQADAVELCTELKTNTSPNSAILLLSQQNGVFDRIRAKMAGSDEFLAKPLPMEDFVEAVERQIGSRANDEELTPIPGADSAHSTYSPSERLKRPASMPTV